MTRVTFTTQEVAWHSDELVDEVDVVEFFSEARLPLNHFGIVVSDALIIFTTSYNSALGTLADMKYTVERASGLLDLVREGIVTVKEISSSNRVLDYYNTFLSGHSDNTVFDYHNSYVLVVLDALVDVLVARLNRRKQ